MDEEEEPSEARQTAKGSPKGERSESTQAQPMQRSGGVRAISHLEEPVRRDSSVPLSQRGVQAMGRYVQGVKPTGPSTPPADGVAAAKASGIFAVVRHQYNQGGNEHFMDENGQLQPRNESRSLASPSPRAKRPSWADESEVHADHEPGFSPSPQNDPNSKPEIKFQLVAAKSNAPTQSKRPANTQPDTSKAQSDPTKLTNPPPPPKPSTTRLLTEGEKQLVKSVFGDSIKDLDKVEIRNRNFIPFQRRGTTMTPNGNMYLAKDLRHVKDFSKEQLYPQAHLIHEMTHVWQKQDGMSVKARGLFSLMAPYDYQYETGKDFRQYRLEQQATMIADYFLALRGEKIRPQSRDDSKSFHLRSPAEYEALIPWLKDLRKNAPKPPTLPSPQPLP